ncbi:MAG: DUF4175 family protein [Calditrichota bacterium]
MTHSENIQQAVAALDELRRKQRAWDFSGRLSLALASIFALWLSALLVEMIIPLSVGIRTGTVIGFVTLSVVVIIITFWRLLTDPRLKPGKYAEEWWALRLGQCAPEILRDRLLNAIQINRSEPSSRDDFSPALARQALLAAVADLPHINSKLALDPQRLRIGKRVAALILPALLAVFIMQPERASQAVRRLMHPRTTYEQPPLYSLSVEPAGGWVYRSEPVEFSITAQGEAPRSVELVYWFADNRPQTERVSLTAGQGRVEMEGLGEDMTYQVRGETALSPEYQLKVVTRPQIVELQYKLTPPAYSKLPAVVGKDNAGDMEALPGSQAELTIRANKPLSSAWLIFQEDNRDSTRVDTLSLAIKNQSASTSWNIRRECRYTVRLRDAGGHPDRDPINYRIHLLPDDPPAVRIAFPDVDVEIGEDLKLPLQVEAEDDFGVGRLRLSWLKLSPDSARGGFELKMTRPGALSTTSEILWNLAEIDLTPGDVIEYWAEAWDTDNIRGPKRSESEHRMVRLPSIEEIVARVEGTEKESVTQAENALQAAKELREEVNNLVQEMRRDPQVNWERRKQVESALEQQANLEKQMADFNRKLDELINSLEKHDLASPETLEKYMQLQQLIAEVASPELKAAMEKLQQAMAQQDPEAVRKALEQFDMNREEFLKSIERSLNILKQLQLERRLDELTRQAEELLHEQEQILTELDTSPPPSQAPRQEKLANQDAGFEKNLGEVQKLAGESQEKQLADQLQGLQAQLETQNTQGKMQQAAQLMESGQKNSAQAMGEDAARDLADMLAKLSAASKELKERRKDEVARKMRRLVEELLMVSQEQESLVDKSRRLGTQSPQYRGLAGDQGDLYQALGGIANRMFALSQETFFITPELGARIGSASQSMEEALEGYTNRNPRTVTSPQEKSLGEINRAAEQLVDVLGELQGSSSSTGYEEMMQKLSEMASQQQGLNQQSMPMPGPGVSRSFLAASRWRAWRLNRGLYSNRCSSLAKKGKVCRKSWATWITSLKLWAKWRTI